MSDRFFVGVGGAARFWVLAAFLAATGAFANTTQISPVSLVELIVSPELHKGNVVQTSGFLTHGIGLDIYLTAAHARMGDVASAIAVYPVDDRIGRCAGDFVIIVGEFNRSDGEGRFEIVRPIEVRTRAGNAMSQSTCWSRRPADEEVP